MGDLPDEFVAEYQRVKAELTEWERRIVKWEHLPEEPKFMMGWLERLALQAESARRPVAFKYKSYEAFLLDQGVLMVGGVRVEKAGKLKQCYENSWVLSRHAGYEYVEGYAMHQFLPVEHAWCMDGDEVVETTWRTPGVAYLGLIRPRAWWAEQMIELGYYGVIANDWRRDGRLLK